MVLRGNGPASLAIRANIARSQSKIAKIIGFCDLGLGIKTSALSFVDYSRSQGRKMGIALRPSHLARECNYLGFHYSNNFGQSIGFGVRAITKHVRDELLSTSVLVSQKKFGKRDVESTCDMVNRFNPSGFPPSFKHADVIP